MDKKNRQKLIGTLIVIAREAKPAGTPDLVREYWSGEKSFGFERTTDEKFAEALRLLLQNEGWSEKWSERYLSSRIAEIIRALYEEGDHAQAPVLVDQLVANYESHNDEYLVFVPVANMKMTLHSLQVGQVTLRRLTPKFINQYRRHVEAAFSESDVSDEELPAFVDRQVSSLERLGEVLSEFRLIAEPRRAQERADEETRRALDVLRFLTTVIWSPTPRRIAVISGEGLREGRAVHVVSSAYTSFHRQWNGEEGCSRFT